MKRLPETLLEALRAKECVLFIGSGISQWSGLPDWESLLKQLSSFLESRGLLKDAEKTEINTYVHDGDLLTAASLCSSKMRKADLSEFIDTVFLKSNPKPSEIHRILVDLGPDSFVTTNYDSLIDEAYQLVHNGLSLAHVNNDQPIEQAKIMKHGASRFIFTPHGRADAVDTIILSREDYRRIQYGAKAVTKSLEHLFISRPVVYVGFGLRDPDFLMIKDQIYSTFHGAELEHFAIMPDVSDMVKEFWRKQYGISIISYSTQQIELVGKDGREWKRSHDELLELLRALYAELKVPTAAIQVTTGAARHQYSSLFRSSIIRFCEDVVHSFADTQSGVTLSALFRADLSPADTAEKIGFRYRRLPILELINSIPSLVIIGPPGAGKTYAIQSYARILAGRALKVLRATERPTDKTMNQTIPLILAMREYDGNIEDMIKQRLPRSVDAAAVLGEGLFTIIFDAINEVSQIHSEVLSRDIGLFLAKYPSNRFILTSRAMHYVPVSVVLPVFELQPVWPSDLEDYLKSKGIAAGDLTKSMQQTLQNPLLLSMFIELRGRTAEAMNPAGLLKLYFEAIERKFESVSSVQVLLMPMLTQIAYRLVEEGSQALTASEIESEFRRVIAKQDDRQRVNAGEILKALISLGLLVADAEGKVGFFHQTALEYVAAVELLSRYSKGSVSVRKLLELRRWDETIILFISLLPVTERRTILQEISEIDIVFACRAFESATVKDESIGLSLFDIVRGRLSEELLPDAERELLARAAIGLAPYGRKDVLAKWLDDKNREVAGSAAVFLGLMGAKEFVSKFVSKLRADPVLPSQFATALDLLIDKSVIRALVKAGETSREGLAQDNFADVLKRFESGTLYSEIKRLSRSRTPRKRQFAACILSKFESNRSMNILADMLQDSNAEVRWEAIFGLEYSRAAHKTGKVIARMFNLLSDRESGHWAADYLHSVSDASIVLEAEHRIGSPRNAHELINLCAILAKSEPNKARKLLFEKLDNYKRSFHDSLRYALNKLPVGCILPDILGFLRVDNIHLHLTVLETLRSIDEIRLPISEDDCEYLIGLWERSQSKQTSEMWWYGTFIRELLGGQFQAVSKPLLLKRLADTKYPFRVALLMVMFRITINEGDLSPSLIEWIVSKFNIKLQFAVWPAGEIVGKVATESTVREKLIPLLSSPNSCVRSNAYEAIKTAEHRLGRRFLKEQSGE